MHGHLKVLLIEDNPEQARLIQRHAERSRDGTVALEVAGSLSEGRGKIETAAFDVILLDLNLPDSKGLETLESIDQTAPTVPIVVLTSLDDMETALKAVQAGAQDYLGKAQISTEILARTIRYAIERKRIVRELEDRNRELAAFTSVASHDLKAPLRRITQFGEFLRKDVEADAKAKITQDIDFILGQARNMTTLIDSLLEYTRTGRSERPLEPVELTEVVHKAVANLEVAIQESGANLSIGPLPQVLGDPIALTQLFQNLIGNGIKYQTDATPQVQIAAQQQGQEWQIAVKDNGIGIDPKDTDRIFEPFKRLHTQSEFAGTGIGLAICRRIVEQHKGRIWVESEPGQGTTFFVALPKSITVAVPAPEAVLQN